MTAELFAPPEAYERAAARLEKALRSCVLCPRRCRVNRLEGELGFCRASANTAAVNTSQLHYGEEPPISGSKGSGTVFFAGCTLACLFCQNWQISQGGGGEETSPEDLAGVFLGLEMAGAHNINLVTPHPPSGGYPQGPGHRSGLRPGPACGLQHLGLRERGGAAPDGRADRHLPARLQVHRRGRGRTAVPGRQLRCRHPLRSGRDAQAGWQPQAGGRRHRLPGGDGAPSGAAKWTFGHPPRCWPRSPRSAAPAPGSAS